MTETNPRLPIHAATGTGLTAKSWQTEAPLRMLQNNLDPEVAERPDDLVVYGGTGRAARALDLRAPLKPAPATQAVVRLLRSSGIEGPGPDRHLSPEIEAASALVASGAVIDAVEEAIGALS